MNIKFEVGDTVIATSKHLAKPILCVLTEEMITNRMFRAMRPKSEIYSCDGSRLVGPFFVSELEPVPSTKTARTSSKRANVSNTPKEAPEEVKAVREPKKYVSSKKRKRGFF